MYLGKLGAQKGTRFFFLGILGNYKIVRIKYKNIEFLSHCWFTFYIKYIIFPFLLLFYSFVI